MQLISKAKLKKLKDAFVAAKSKRASGAFICWALEYVPNSQEAADLIESRLGSETLGTYMHACGFKNYRGHGSRTFNAIRDLWLNMLINEHSSYDMYLKARFRDFLIHELKNPTPNRSLVRGFSYWCHNSIDHRMYTWLFDCTKSKLVFKRYGLDDKDVRAWANQYVQVLTNELIQEPK